MLRIRSEQIGAFGPLADAVFAKRVAEYVRETHSNLQVRFPTETLTVAEIPEELLEKTVQEGIDRARGYGLSWETSLSAFVVLMFVSAPNFDSHPQVRQILTSAAVSADHRMDRLWEGTSERVWEEIRKNYDPKEWNLGSSDALIRSKTSPGE